MTNENSKESFLAEFERMLREFGGRRYHAETDTYRQLRGKKFAPVCAKRVRKAAEMAEKNPDRWAAYLDVAINGGSN